MQTRPYTHVRIGRFELDLKTGELRSADGAATILLREQAFQVLRLLAERTGKIVTREEIKSKLWPNDTVVDFDHSINTVIKTLRRAVGDSAEAPQYIETLARRGYRLRVAAEWFYTVVENVAQPPSAVAPSAASESLIGTKVSHYRVLGVIGGGGMGMVYRAEDLKLGRPVALKFLPDDLVSDSVALKRFEREAQTASALNHPNICTIYEIEEHGGQPFIAMELLQGDTLRDRLAGSEANRIPAGEALEIALQICAGLDAAHEKGIVHRDIKPANIFLTRQGSAKILDFGLAKLAVGPEGAEERTPERTDQKPLSSTTENHEIAADGIQTALTQPGTTAGTAGYMSPEQIRKEVLDARSDLFSFGMVLYEMAAGRRAFQGETVTEIQNAILHGTPKPLRGLGSAASRLDPVIAKALEKDRERRYQSAAEIRADLERVQKEMQPARRYFITGLRVAAMVLILVSGLWYYWSYRSRATLSPTDTVVLSDIENRTSDPVLDDALTVALRYGLGQTPYLNILSTDKVFGTLASLKLPPTTKLAPDVARQVCQASNSKMVLASSIADAGNGYRVELRAIDCSSAKTVAQVRNAVPSRSELIHQFGILEAQLRDKLGEPKASLARYNKPLEEATSSSPEALQAGLVGYKHHLAADLAGAVVNYKRAVELDPKLGLAHEALATAYRGLGNPELEISAKKKAYELRDRMTEPNRLNVEYLYFKDVTGEQEKALASISQLVQAFPLDFGARINLSDCLSSLGQRDRAADEAREAVRLLPSALSYANSAIHSIYANRFNEAQATLEEANSRHLGDLHDSRLRLAFLQGDQAALQKLWAGPDGESASNPVFLLERSDVEGYYGRARTKRELAQKATTIADKSKANLFPYSRDRTAHDSLYEANVGNFALARKQGEKAPRNVGNRDTQILLGFALARAGATANAQKLANDLDQQYPLDTLMQNLFLPTIRAAVRLNQNDPAGAVALLQPAFKYELAFATGLNSVDSAYVRGLAYLQMGQGRLAATEFQKLVDHRGLVGSDVTGALAHLQIGRAQKMAGDDSAARKSYEEFLTLWKDADPDIPVYREAKAEYAALRKSSAGTN